SPGRSGALFDAGTRALNGVVGAGERLSASALEVEITQRCPADDAGTRGRARERGIRQIGRAD
ncbi:MAG TPA: hypothetical protein VIS73_09990, partial [Rhodocyclaceae bacterium]